MAIPLIEVHVFFTLSSGGGATTFTLDDPVKGVLDNVTYVLAGDIETDVSDRWANISITRGRSRELDDFNAGELTINFRNHDRAFDSLYTSGPYYGNIKPGKRIRVRAAGITIFDGHIDDWDLSHELGGMPYATVKATDALGVLARQKFNQWTTTAGQKAGARLGAILDRPEVLFGANRNLGTGVSTLQADPVSDDSNVLNYCQLVSRSDLGRFFASRSNELTFRDRSYALTAATAAVFTDGSSGTTGVRPHGFGRRVGSENLYNRVAVDREGGIRQTSSDAASILEFRERPLERTGLLLDSDGQSNDMADYLLGIYKDPEDRISEIRVVLSALDDADHATVLTLDFDSVVRAVTTPGQPAVGNAIDQYVLVEGLTHEITGSRHVVTVATGETVNRTAFILDDPVYGVLDGPGRLAF